MLNFALPRRRCLTSPSQYYHVDPLSHVLAPIAGHRQSRVPLTLAPRLRAILPPFPRRVSKEYLEAAVNYLAEDSSRTPIDDIKGIWVASDDSSVVGEVRKLARTYFPNVSSENILFVSDGVPGGPKRGALATHVNREVRSSSACDLPATAWLGFFC